MKGLRFLQTIQLKLIIIYVLLILIAMQLIGVYFVSTLKNSLIDNFTRELTKQADFLSVYVGPKIAESLGEDKTKKLPAAKKNEGLNPYVQDLLSIGEAEIQVIDTNGIVIAVSKQTQQAYIGQKVTKTLVSRALQGIEDNEEEIVDSDNIRKKVIAKPAMDESGRIVGAVYLEASMKNLYEDMDDINRIFISGTIFALVLTALLGIVLSHMITNPIKEITKQATAVAEGNFDQKVNILGSDEIGQLGEAFNYMTNRLQEALSINEEEKEKLSSILANLSDGVVATDTLGQVILMNRRAMQMLKVAPGRVEGTRLAGLLGMAPEAMRPFLQGNRSTVPLELHPEEEPLLVRVTFTPIQSREKGVTGSIAVLQDVTEQEELEQSRREFVANVSHELRTPLTTIKSYLEALDDGAMEDATLAKRFIGVTRNETERMIRLVTDLLHLSRLDSSKSAIQREETNVLEMLEEVADRFAFQLKQKSIRLRVIRGEGVERARIDRDQVDQVLDNLVSNAIKYMPDGGQIELSARKPDAATVEIAVKDTGIGIPKKDLGRIFDRFYRVDKARSRNMGGTGLGLSIAREIVKAHGGTIALESEINQGTKVSFTLPVGTEGSESNA
ncbi:histidine kinase [Paenibacillus swuensis]|uniref:histidine kinase n=1 Tax=Paenibacillus swuensis TaxID=1178515 RepID=A0A172TGG6_9BACL|nr:cell wall metabolism sensor histidine kinase WalK [Paenibacillus swuensis]ANE46052.1 histidine kinase [Paenibacillus swuensis]